MKARACIVLVISAVLVLSGCGGKFKPDLVALRQASISYHEEQSTLHGLHIAQQKEITEKKVAEAKRIEMVHKAVTKASRSSVPVDHKVYSGDVWAALANCESHGNPRAIGGGGRYFGAFQFALSTWYSLGYTGNPIDASYEVQREAAQRLVARSGWGQFPVCGRRVA